MAEESDKLIAVGEAALFQGRVKAMRLELISEQAKSPVNQRPAFARAIGALEYFLIELLTDDDLALIDKSLLDFIVGRGDQGAALFLIMRDCANAGVWPQSLIKDRLLCLQSNNKITNKGGLRWTIVKSDLPVKKLNLKPEPALNTRGRRLKQLDSPQDWDELVRAMMQVHGHLGFEEFLRMIRQHSMDYGFASPVVSDERLANLVRERYQELKKPYANQRGNSSVYGSASEPVLINENRRFCRQCGIALNIYNTGAFCNGCKKPKK